MLISETAVINIYIGYPIDWPRVINLLGFENEKSSVRTLGPQTRGNDAPSSSQQSYQKKKRVFNKTPNFSVWSLCDLHRRVISAVRVAEAQRVAGVAERDGLVASAIHAGHR